MQDADLQLLSRAKNYNAKINIDRSISVSTGDLEKKLHSKETDTITVSDCLESIDNVTVALAKIREALLRGSKVALTINSKSGYWSWSRETFIGLLTAAGIEYEFVSEKGKEFTLKLHCTVKGYDDFLMQNHLPSADIQHLIVTTEHSDYRVTGGIGSYAKECHRLYGDKASVLLLDSNTDVDIEIINSKTWFAAQQFLSIERINNIEFSNFDTVGDLVLEVLESILCLYPQIQTIESQEMLLGRVIAAKRQGILGYEPHLITVCHGSSFHLAKAQRNVIEAENIHVAYREKYTLENSDSVIFPTNFLRESYKQSGVQNLDDDACVTKRLPFAFDRLPEGKTLESYKRLIYIGKTSTVKGFDLFLESILELHEKNPTSLEKIEEILVIATSTHISEPYLQKLYIEAESKLPIRMVSMAREELLNALAEYSADSLALVTYLGDNHPLAVLEFMAVGLDFIAADAAGTPELIPEKFKKYYLIAPNKMAFATATALALSNAEGRSLRIAELREAYIKEQIEINKTYNLECFKTLPTRSNTGLKSNKQTIEIIIIDTENNDDKLQSTIASLDRQSLRPDTVKVLNTNLFDPDENSGDLIMRLYAGDILTPTALKQLRAAIGISDKTGVSFAYEMTPTYEGQRFIGIKEFHPYSPQLGSVFLQEKYGRRFVGLFKRDYFTFHAPSDWQKAINATCQGASVEIVPRLLFGLAETKHYPEWNKMKDFSDLISSFSALPTFDAFILHSELFRFNEIYWGNNLRNHMQNKYIDKQEAEILYGPPAALRKIIIFYRMYTPKSIRKFIYTSLKFGYKFLRKVRRAISS